MALFGSKKKAIQKTQKVKPTVVQTQNVAKELAKVAKSYEIKVDTLDFNLLGVRTYTRVYDEKQEGEWHELFENELYELDDQTALLNPYFQIKQMFEIEIFSRIKENNPYENFKLAIGANATKCKIYLSIAEGSIVEYNPRFEQDLRVLINKRKIRSGILVNIFDEMLSDVVSKISAHVRVEERAVYHSTQTHLIAESYEATLTQNDEIILHFNKVEEIDEHTKIDYASRGFIKNVKENELLIEYKKSKVGTPGRNCRGEFLNPEDPITKNFPTFKVDDTIKVLESDTEIKYIAKENGYITLEDNIYKIKTDVDLNQISFKTTGSIDTGLDSDVSIVVSEKDAIKDAIGTGMKVEVTEIDIDGNVGSNANVFAKKANIGGQTHKTAKIRADNLDINIHKGMAYGKNIHITRLEHGIIDGDIVEVSQAVGGNIRAKEITIELCASHVKATASRFIEIKKLQGSENFFTIDPLLKKSTKKDLVNNEESIKELGFKIKEIAKDIQKYQKRVEDGRVAFNDIKKRLLHYKKNGIKMPESFVKKYKQFQKMEAHLKALQEDKSAKEEHIELLSSNSSTFQENIFDARIINRDRWVGHNELKFIMVDPPMEITYNPPEGSPNKVFGLVEVDEGEYEIRAVAE